MYCDIYDLIDKNEMYARGWVRLFGQMNTTSVAQMAQYATDIMKLKLLHQKDCWRCQRTNTGTSEAEDALPKGKTNDPKTCASSKN